MASSESQKGKYWSETQPRNPVKKFEVELKSIAASEEKSIPRRPSQKKKEEDVSLNLVSSPSRYNLPVPGVKLPRDLT